MVFEDKERSFGPQYYLDRQTRNSARPNIEHCSHVKIGHCNVKEPTDRPRTARFEIHGSDHTVCG